MYEQNGVLIKNKFKEHLVPTILTTMSLSLATVVDSVIVGQLLGSTSLAAIGLATPIVYLINIVYVLFGVGGMMCASVARGALKTKKADRLFTMAVAGGVAVMSLLALAVVLFIDPITMALSDGNAEMASLTKSYILPLIFTGPALILSNGIALFMRADGKPGSSAMIVVISNAVNLVLDFVLIRFANAGVMGAGLSTTLGYVFGIFVVLPYLLNIKGRRNFRFTALTEPFKLLSAILLAGLPKGCGYIAAFGRSLVLNTIVMSTFGTSGITVLTVLLNVLSFATVFVSGTGDTLFPIVGALFGERDILGIKKIVSGARAVLAASSIGIMIFFCTCSSLIGGMFGLQASEEFEMLKYALYMFALYVPLYATVITLQNFYNITGREKAAIAIALTDGFVFVCSFAVLLPLINSSLLWLCYALGSACTFILILVYAAVVNKKENVKGLLLLRESNDEPVWDLSITASPEQAVGVAKKVVEFCREHAVEPGLANRLGIGIEEMAMATATHAHCGKEGRIDILIRINNDEILIRFRDNGTPFDPLQYEPSDEDGLITDGISLLKQAANNISYSIQLGFNITVLTFTS